MTKYRLKSLLALACLALALATPAAAGQLLYGIAMHGEPQLPADFDHFPHVNPDAPKGGSYREAVVGTFDSLNPFIIKGQPIYGLRSYVYESLLARNTSEAFSLYPLIAKSIEVPDDRSFVTFHLDERAHFSDGVPITAKDVVFSWKTLRDEGRPNYRSYYSKVTDVETPDDHTVTFRLAAADRELVLILGLMPVLPAHFYATHDFNKTTLEPGIGSGPYVVSEVRAGERVVLKRDPDYWGRDVPASRGQWNFDEVRFDYYRDSQAAFEAFKKGLADVRNESDPIRWATGYDFPAVAEGKVIKEVVPSGLPAPLSALVFNTRRAIFSDVRVRQALIYAFDFEWANANLFRGLFERTEGYFAGSILSSHGRPASPGELKLLAAAGANLPAEFLDGTYSLPVSNGSGLDRKNLRKAVNLLHQAGWEIRDGVMVQVATGAPLRFQMVVQSRDQEKIGLHFQRSLAAIGIHMDVRLADSSQFQRLLQTYDFDMLPYTWYNSLSPGNEQVFYWGSIGRDHPGTRNYMGADDPAIDKLIDAMLKATAQSDFVDAVRALDRTLMAHYYVIPLYNAPGQWVARWSYLKYPKTPSLYGYSAASAWHQAD